MLFNYNQSEIRIYLEGYNLLSSIGMLLNAIEIE